MTFAGRYNYAELASLMSNVDWIVVPSIWWENSPLVIQEAFHFGRPVICSDIGGMAEKVDDGVNGLHFRAGDPTSLARTIKRAAEEPQLWERLRERNCADVWDGRARRDAHRHLRKAPRWKGGRECRLINAPVRHLSR